MSRRKALDTNLSGRPTPNATSTPSKTRTDAKLPPHITPPNPEQASATNPASATTPGQQEIANTHVDEQVIDVDDTSCIICAETITYWSVGVCGHRTCHVCAVRLRTFYKKYECTFCKTVTPSLLFSGSPTSPFPAGNHVRPCSPNRIGAAQANMEKLEKGKVWYEGMVLPGTLDLGAFQFTDDKLGVVFEDEDLMEVTLLLLRFNCPAPDCAHMAVDWNTLEKHTLSNHASVICRVCRSQLSRFAHEQVLYPPHLLALHDPSRLRPGQKPPRPRGDKELEMVKTWDAPHPMCEFCHQAFFGPDELFTHMRGKHEECFVCKELGERNVYFKDYAKLEQHFSQDHFPCTQTTCLEQKFVVFPSDMDLRAHMVSEHGEQMTARDRAQARTVQIDFPSYSDNRHRGSQRQERPSGRGFTIARTSVPAGPSRGNDVVPHAQHIAQMPLMTEQQAAQHRRQVQTDRQEGRRRKAFVTDLTASAKEHDGQHLDVDMDGTRSGFATPRENVDDATAERHAALLSRVTLLVNDSNVKLQSFRSAVRQYRNNESGAKDMIDTIFHVLDRDVDATSGVVRELAGLFEGDGEGGKQRSVLESLNGFRVEQREQFPALNVPSGLGSEWAGITSGKILNAKRATHTNGRGGASSRIVWDRVEAAASSSQSANRPARRTAGANGRYVPGAGGVAASSAFPSLSGPSAGSSKPTAHSTPWSSGGAGSSSRAPPALTGPIIRSVNYSTGLPAKARQLNASAFPSLPTSGKSTATERQELFNKPNPREESIRRITGQGAAPPPTNGWDVGGATNGVDALDLNASDTQTRDPPASGGGGGKKKGKQKQLLFTVSARPN